MLQEITADTLTRAARESGRTRTNHGLTESRRASTRLPKNPRRINHQLCQEQGVPTVLANRHHAFAVFPFQNLVLALSTTKREVFEEQPQYDIFSQLGSQSLSSASQFANGRRFARSL